MQVSSYNSAMCWRNSVLHDDKIISCDSKVWDKINILVAHKF